MRLSNLQRMHTAVLGSLQNLVTAAGTPDNDTVNITMTKFSSCFEAGSIITVANSSKEVQGLFTSLITT